MKTPQSRGFGVSLLKSLHSGMRNKSNNIPLWFITTAFLWGVAIFYLGSDILHTTDAQRYAILAKNLLDGKGYTLAGWPELVYPPGYSFVLIPFLILGISFDKAIALLNAIAIFGLAVIIYKLVQFILGRQIAIVSSLFIVANGNIVYWASLGMVEPVWLLSLFASGYFFLLRKNKFTLLSGFLAGFSYLFKPETLGYVFIFLMIHFLKKEKDLIKYLRFLIPFILIVFSYSFWLYKNSGILTYSGKTAGLYWDSFIENKNLKQYDLAYFLHSDNSVGITLKDKSPISINLIKRLSINLNNAKRALFEILLPLKIILFALLLSFVKLKKKSRYLIYASAFLFPSFSSLVFHIENRYLIFFIVYVVFIITFAIFTVNRRRVNKLVSLFLLFTLVVITYYSYWPLKTEFKNLKIDKSEIKTAIADSNIQNSLILSTKPVYSYFLEKDYYPLPRVDDYDKLKGFFNYYSNYVVILDDWSKNTMSKEDAYIQDYANNLGLTKVGGNQYSKIRIFKK